MDLLWPLLTTSKVVYFAYDLAEQRAVYVSDAYEQLIGDPLSHLADDLPHLLSRLHPDDWQYLRQLLAAPAAVVHDVELRLARPQPQGWQWLSVSAHRTQPATSPAYLVGTVRDITLAKDAVRNAQKFNTKKDAILEILSHDLATPFSLLQQLTEQLAHEVGGDDIVKSPRRLRRGLFAKSYWAVEAAARRLLHFGFGLHGAVGVGFHLTAFAHHALVAAVGARRVVHAVATTHSTIVGGGAGTRHIGRIAGLGAGCGAGGYRLGYCGTGSERDGGG